MGGARGPVGLQTEGPRETGAPTCAKYLSVCSVGIVRLLFDLSESIIVCAKSCVTSLLGESASPFIDKWDGLTSERGRVYVCY